MNAFLLIIFVLALALAPLAHFLPSKQQRRIAGLREYAALQGLFVEFRSAPLEVPGGTQRYPKGATLYYGLRLPSKRRHEPVAQVWVRGDGGWRSSLTRAAPPVELADLPADVFAVAADSHSCGVYWQESGELTEIDEICLVLRALVQQIAS